jgi:hypothetical protein
MQSLSAHEAKQWCLSAGLKLAPDGRLRYKRATTDRFFLGEPEEHRRIVLLARSLSLFRNEADFAGGLLWLRRWNIGAPEMVRAGWLILENIRRAHGDSRSLELAPAQLFRSDESAELQCFLIQVIAFGWVVEFVPSSGQFFAHFKDNGQICVESDSQDTQRELRKYLEGWSLTNEDPMVAQIATLAKRRRAKRALPG